MADCFCERLQVEVKHLFLLERLMLDSSLPAPTAPDFIIKPSVDNFFHVEVDVSCVSIYHKVAQIELIIYRSRKLRAAPSPFRLDQKADCLNSNHMIYI